ncbi:hypothetical protein MiSe_72870 [Microseira wollei NIES-4236]|uniref:Uncharacterized protein n=1 Tax=Microseira wollei NIES-4236 TaxID=2530354 RepID=A0AAV3XKL6_9CYAN|nr:hypothetical protein MiSe_72870 [Microseira wollei NIES-4236]
MVIAGDGKRGIQSGCATADVNLVTHWLQGSQPIVAL